MEAKPKPRPSSRGQQQVVVSKTKGKHGGKSAENITPPPGAQRDSMVLPCCDTLHHLPHLNDTVASIKEPPIHAAPNIIRRRALANLSPTKHKLVRADNYQWRPHPRRSPTAATPPSHAPGLPNLGNTCYLNSILQVLLNCVPFTTALAHACRHLPTLAPNGVAHTLHACSTQHAARTAGLLDPRPLRRALVAVAPQFAGVEQHDAHELFCALTDALQQEVFRAEVHVLNKGGRLREGIV